MATIALPRPMSSVHMRPSSPRPITIGLNLESINTSNTSNTYVPVPNKHIPICPPGPAPLEAPDTPPQSPLWKEASSPQSLLYPTDKYEQYQTQPRALYKIEAASVQAALEYAARQPSPDPTLVFPWLHGLHQANHVQQTFLMARRRITRSAPRCLRGITVVKADGNLSRSKIKGAVAATELLQFKDGRPLFKDVDPPEGFSIRNFQIQAVKYAMLSDIIVYGADEKQVVQTGNEFAIAQDALRSTGSPTARRQTQYNVFLYIGPFAVFERQFPALVAINQNAQLTGKVLDFSYQERLEMCTMAKASEIAHNVWLGPTPDPYLAHSALGGKERFDVQIECGDHGRIEYAKLREIAEKDIRSTTGAPICVEFPSSGSIVPPTWSQVEADSILDMCMWIYNLAHGTKLHEDQIAAEEGSSMTSPSAQASRVRGRRTQGRKILLHCTDGYTESTLLALCYYVYATGLPLCEAWLHLHVTRKRNFFAYPTDVALLNTICPRLLLESPALKTKSLREVTGLAQQEPSWFRLMDGSLPSRILDYLYLGNLAHANNPGLLRGVGIGQILSVGEKFVWPMGELEQYGEENVMIVQMVQDNGVDPLTDEFERCLGFIARGRARGTATLVHCRVGVSRSATICIAEVMRSLEFSLPEAYCFVRARRLNVIIQPHLRFVYELLRWEEKLKCDRSGNSKRDMEWPEIAREIALLNRPYTR